ncbi:hypothetical protein KCU61_g171, partial [Aureobasidium melanogenum]
MAIEIILNEISLCMNNILCKSIMHCFGYQLNNPKTDCRLIFVVLLFLPIPSLSVSVAMQQHASLHGKCAIAIHQCGFPNACI